MNRKMGDTNSTMTGPHSRKRFFTLTHVAIIPTLI
jgi:hypothetical protein